MLGKCFSILCIISFIFAIFCGNMGDVSKSILNGCEKSVTVCFSLVGVMTLWNGILEVFKESGIIKILSRLLKPILKHIFPKSFKNDCATEEITACISAGLLGVSNAVTPLAINAISKMERGVKKEYATNDMIMLCMLGCACFNIIPTTIIALRESRNATISYEIIIPVWICSFSCMLIGIILCRIFGKIYGDS